MSSGPSQGSPQSDDNPSGSFSSWPNPPSSKDKVPPVYCWVVPIDRAPTPIEFNLCYQCLDRPSQNRVTSLMKDEDELTVWSCLVGRLIPHIVQSQRGLRRDDWGIQGNDAGQKPRIYPPMEKHLGFSVAHSAALVAFGFALGAEDRVHQVGCDIHKIHLSKNIEIPMYLDSISHKLTASEMAALKECEPDRERIISRISVLWTLKEALMKAIGQPLRVGFDWRRVSFNIQEESVTLDGKPVTGWEFRLFVAHFTEHDLKSSKRKDSGPALKGKHQIACAIHRGGTSNTFVWNRKGGELDSWLRFITMDMMMDAVMTLGAHGYPHIEEYARQRSLQAAAQQRQSSPEERTPLQRPSRPSSTATTQVQEFDQHSEYSAGPPPPPPPPPPGPPRTSSRFSQMQKEKMIHIDTSGSDRGRDWDRESLLARERRNSPVIIPVIQSYPQQPNSATHSISQSAPYPEYRVSPPISSARPARERDRERERDRDRDRDRERDRDKDSYRERERESSLSSVYSSQPSYSDYAQEAIIVPPTYIVPQSAPSHTQSHSHSHAHPHPHSSLNHNPQPAPVPLLRPMSSSTGMARPRRPGQ